MNWLLMQQNIITLHEGWKRVYTFQEEIFNRCLEITNYMIAFWIPWYMAKYLLQVAHASELSYNAYVFQQNSDYHVKLNPGWSLILEKMRIYHARIHMLQSGSFSPLLQLQREDSSNIVTLTSSDGIHQSTKFAVAFGDKLIFTVEFKPNILPSEWHQCWGIEHTWSNIIYWKRWHNKCGLIC